jgi:DNA-binding winged helix-turn-helix (wHTH) protein
MYRLRMKLRDMPGLTLETIPKRGFRLTIAAPE